MFTILFGSLIAMVNESRNKKLALVALGNLVGLFWNFVFLYFYNTGKILFGIGLFDAIFTLVFPLLNLLWIVPFWSLSLSSITKADRVTS
jgi:hypothetical protein